MNSDRKLYNIVIVLVLIFLSSFYYIYAEKNTDYTINDVQIQCLFESEQEILETYDFCIDTSNIISDITEDLKSLADSDIIVDETVVLDNVIVSDKMVSNVENMIYQGLNNMVFSELAEEIYVGNRLASREIEFEVVGSSEETTDEKLFRLFGSEAPNLRGRIMYYPGGEEEALQYMESFKVTIWDLDANGEWYQRTQWLSSHYTLVDSLKCIFSELLELPEEDRVPIKSMGCYHYREGSSAHTCGAAIDINWEENAEMTIDGVITCGYFWKPDENIYSIKPDSPFVHVFEKYGWTWGGYWTSKKDYMHFSYIDR